MQKNFLFFKNLYNFFFENFLFKENKFIIQKNNKIIIFFDLIQFKEKLKFFIFLNKM